MKSETYTDTYGREYRHNEQVVIEMLLGVPDEKRIGRLVQVRLNAGQFGSDIYLIRLRDGSLASFENVMIRRADDKRFEDAFYRSNGKQPPVIPEQPVNEADSPGDGYTIAGEWLEIGFIVEHPKQPRTPGSFTLTVKGPTETKIETHVYE